MAGQVGFAAFISYSSADAAFARRLHKALEGYRVPSGAGSFNLAGKPNRVAPVFLDRAELSSGELGSAIATAIEKSTALIVLCSPHAARSEWVDKEIRHFVETGRVQRIFAIIASGEPFASDHGAPDNECFPLALRDMAAGRLGAPYEVVAGDARPAKDGFRNAWLKVAAGILDVSFGKLLDRDAAARRGRAMLLGSTAAVVAAVVGTLTTFWFLESQRFQNEARASLMREARSAFELDDSARALTALATLAPGMPAEERAIYQPVLDAWSGRFPHVATTIGNAPAAFAHGERVFLKTPGGIIATPLPADAVFAAGGADDPVLRIDFTGRVWEWKPGAAEAQDLQFGDALGGNDWSSAVKLTPASALFGGSLQASYYGGQEPVIAFVNGAARSFALLDLNSTPVDEIRLEADCSAFAFHQTSIDYVEQEDRTIQDVVTDNGFQRLGLKDAAAKLGPISAEEFAAMPPLKLDSNGGQFERVKLVLDAVASTCGGTVALGPPPNVTAKQASSSHKSPFEETNGASGVWDWIAYDLINQEPPEDGPEVARLAALSDAIQRAQLEVGKITRIRDGAPDTMKIADDFLLDDDPDPQADAQLVGDEYSRLLGIHLSLDETGEPALAFYAAEGKSVGSNACGFVDGKARCIGMTQTGWGVQFAAFPDFIYAGGTNYLQLPVFTLIDRKTFNAVEFRSDEFNIAEPAYGGSVAVSPSGRRMAIAFKRTVLLFDIGEQLVPKLTRRLNVPGLADGPADGLRPVCAALTFLDEATLVASRGDGLNLKLDLQSGEELWRFRLPASVGCEASLPYVPVQAAPSPDGKRIAVTGSSFAAILDVNTGLPLLPVAKFDPVTRWEDEGLYTDDIATRITGGLDIDPAAPDGEQAAEPEIDPFACAESGVGCRTEAQLIRSARNMLKLSEPMLGVGPAGEVVVRSLTGVMVLDPPPKHDPVAAIAASPKCLTGWQVQETRIEPFDLMKDIGIGMPPVPEVELAARCS